MKQKPIAYRSPLWAHLDDIRKWRQGGDTWQQIAAKLKAEPYKITTSFQAVQAFFKRSGKVSDPLGYQIKKQQPRQNQPSAPAQPDAKKEPTGHTYEKWVETERQKEKEKSNEPFKTYE